MNISGVRCRSVVRGWLRQVTVAAVVLAGACDQAWVGGAHIVVDPAGVDLGVLRPGVGASAIVRLANTGTAPAQITELALDGPLAAYVGLDATVLPIEVPAGGVAEIPVTLLETPALDVMDTGLTLVATVEGITGTGSGCNSGTRSSGVIEIPVYVLGPGRCDQDEDGVDALACGGLDCDDLNAAVKPGEAEWCDGLDNDCNGEIDDNSPLDGMTYYPDADGDLFGADLGAVTVCAQPDGYVPDGGDCDDTTVAVGPHATEVCNGVDDDCDGRLDVGAVDGSPYWPDLDADGYGNPDGEELLCGQPQIWVTNGDDCDDLNQAVSPSATEACNGVDDNCDGVVDELGALDGVTYYADRDGDLWGDHRTAIRACSPLQGFVVSDGDCDDGATAVNPGAPERCDAVDHNCDGDATADAIDAPTFYADRDADLFGDPNTGLALCTAIPGFILDDQDCDDFAKEVNPGAPERCNGLDDNCNGVVDETALDTNVYWSDGDGDGFGDAASAFDACGLPDGAAANDRDCDDTRADVFPGAPELCDGLDNNCDGQADDGVQGTWYADADADGFGDASAGAEACGQPEGTVADATDCDDARADVNPAASEQCDAVDHDCDGVPRNETVFYGDGDRDGYGDPARTVSAAACAPPPDVASNGDDCDDTAFAVHPGAPEVCNGVDDDCNALVDDNATDRQRYYRDVDMDGWGNPARFRVACDAPAGWLAQEGDCADGDPAVHPGALDVCNGVDDDCNGVVDDGADGVTWYADRDGDGYGKPGVHQRSCFAVPGFVDNFSDCADENSAIFPGAPEVCDGLDNDCNTLVDDNPVDGITAFVDRDADGFGRDSSRVQVCARPGPEWVDRGGDCDDNAISTFPGAPEVCDGRDQNCDGLQDDGNVCPCPVDWYGDHAYAVCDLVAVPWVVAGQICRGGGYELVTIDDAAEDAFLTDIGGGLAWWIGYNDRGRVEGRYRWASGLTSSYESWAPGEPNNAGNEDCVELLPDGTWNDLPCGDTHPFICESPAP